MIKAIVFDFDGLILDTETAEYETYQEMYREHQCELTLDVWGACIGTSNMFNPYDHLETLIGSPYDRERARAARQARFEQRMNASDVRPGVRDYLREAKELGLRIGLASSSKLPWVAGYLEAYGLLEHFEVIRTAENVEKVKPDPALYLQATEALGVRPEEAIAFEDSPNGALAAKRAGMYCVIVPNAVTGRLTFGLHDLQLTSMQDLSLALLVERLSGQEAVRLDRVD